MKNLTKFAVNKFIDAIRGQALGMPATWHVGLIVASKGVRANSTTYALNDTIVVLVNAVYRLYKCTTGGASAGAQPGGYTGAADEAVTDGTAVFTEQTASIYDATALVEPVGSGYARVALAASLANLAGTQGAGSTAASTGASGTTSNNGAITFGTPTGDWYPAAGGRVVGMALFDASSGGNAWIVAMLANPKSVSSGDPAPSFAAATFAFTLL